jgi:iron(III) transport system substrate-binding protein
MSHIVVRNLIGALIVLLVATSCGAAPSASNAPTSAPAAPAATDAPAATAAPSTTEAPAETEAPATEAATSASAATSEAAATTEAAATSDLSGELVVYSTRAEALFNVVLEAFNAQYPNVKVTVVRGSNGELAAKLLEEQGSPQADVLVNSDTLTMEDLAKQGLFEPNDSELIQQVPAEYRADDGSWVALTLRGRVIMYNTDLVSEEDAPKSILSLTDPQWKGQVGSADSTNGAMMGHIVAMERLVGTEQTTEFVNGLVANETQFFGSHTDVRKAVGAGELKLGFVNHYYYYLSKAEGAPVGIIWPDQGEGEMGLVVNSTNIGIVKGSQDVELAKVFVDFMLSPEGQKVYAEGNYEWPIQEGIELAEGVDAPDQFKVADIELKTLHDELPSAQEIAQAAALP